MPTKLTRVSVLRMLADRINRAHAECESLLRTTVEKAIPCGQALIDAKAALPHGEWLP